MACLPYCPVDRKVSCPPPPLHTHTPPTPSHPSFARPKTSCPMHPLTDNSLAVAVPNKGASVLAYSPHCPVDREEKWYVVLADPPQNLTLSWSVVSLNAAEDVGRGQAALPPQPSPKKEKSPVKLGVKRAVPPLEGGEGVSQEEEGKEEEGAEEGALVHREFRSRVVLAAL